jgi:hypothetical protein
MNKRSDIFLKIFLLIIVFACSGINIHSDTDMHRYYLNQSTGTNNIENSLTPDIDFSDEDQIANSSILGLTEQPECQKYGLNSLPLLNILSVSVWQPPKIF